MIYNHTEKDIRIKLKDAEINALRQYCAAQGFTEEETVIFIKNSLAWLFDEAE